MLFRLNFFLLFARYSLIYRFREQSVLGKIFLTPTCSVDIAAQDFTPALMAGIGFRLVLLDSIDLTFNFSVSQFYSKSVARLTLDGG